MSTETNANELDIEHKRTEYRNRRDRIENHYQTFNSLSASILAMDDNAWHETQKYARPAEMLESMYQLKKAIEPYGRYPITDNTEPLFECIQLMNAFCCKWHAILFYPASRISGVEEIDEPRGWRYAPYTDDELRDDDACLRDNSDNPVVGQITFDDTDFIGKGFIPVFREEINYVRKQVNALRDITRAEIQRLEALNAALAEEPDVW